MRELLAAGPWRTAFRASQWVLAASLVALAVMGLPSVFPALYFIGFGLPFAVMIRVGERLWSTGRTGLLLAIGDLGAFTLALIVMVVEPWTQLQMVVPGEEATLLAVCALAIVGLIGSPFAARRAMDEPRPSLIGGAVVLAIHGALILLLLELLADAMSETDPHGYAGLVLPLVGGPILFLAVGLVAWWVGAWVPLAAVDALLALWGASRVAYVLSTLVPYEDWLTEGALALVWLLLAAVGAIAVFQLRPVPNSPAPEVSQ